MGTGSCGLHFLLQQQMQLFCKVEHNKYTTPAATQK